MEWGGSGVAVGWAWVGKELAGWVGGWVAGWLDGWLGHVRWVGIFWEGWRWRLRSRWHMLMGCIEQQSGVRRHWRGADADPKGRASGSKHIITTVLSATECWLGC